MFVRSFTDSDGDGVGDLAGLTARLDYLNDGDPTTTTDLGVTGIWLMPVAEAASYHGYDAIDLRSVEGEYGTLDDMRALVRAAHERGIAVISDLVLNHTSDEHPWFVDASVPGSAHEDWYIWSDTNPGYGGPDGQEVWHEKDGRFYYGLFGADLPDLNLRNKEVTAELVDAATFWLTDVGVDGFRLDAIKHLVEDGRTQVHTEATHDWLRSFRAAVTAAKPGTLLVGEVADVAAGGSGYVPEDVDLVFDFGLAAATVDAVATGRVSQLLTAEDDAVRLFGPGERATFLTNHDQERVASALDGDPSELDLAARLLLARPGLPFVYYGEEIGLTGSKPDERIRTPMPWTGGDPAAGFTTGSPWEELEPGWETRNVADESADDSSVLSAYRAAIRLRAEHQAMRSGTVDLAETGSDSVAAAIQAGGGETLLVVANVGGDAVTDYALAVDESGLCGAVDPEVVAGESAAAGPPAAPTLELDGGFTGYRPFRELPAHSLTVLSLGRAVR
ncbi:MAG TPA: alpha-amylase family glycosyl hydrolase [Candidatus Limnocylindrales bacterium]|nr:alpha-amylase family glycosyl hydrolase [Candidatus Limnocylindrales bacterium]